jgi:8-oxo-dGTP diphosphatase
MDFFIDPGGKIEKGETVKQALVRELKEGLSIDVDEHDLKFFGEFVAGAANHKGKIVNMQVFIVKKWQGTITPDAEIEELRWLTSKLVQSSAVKSYRNFMNKDW